MGDVTDVGPLLAEAGKSMAVALYGVGPQLELTLLTGDKQGLYAHHLVSAACRLTGERFHQSGSTVGRYAPDCFCDLQAAEALYAQHLGLAPAVAWADE